MDRRRFLSLAFTDDKEPLKVTTTLKEWVPDAANPWDADAVQHLYHRLGFGAKKSDITLALATTPSALIDMLMDDELVTTGMPEPPAGWQEWLWGVPYLGPDYPTQHAEDNLQHDAKTDIRIWWTMMMADSRLQVRERLTLFWHNHFVVEELKVYFVAHFFRYFQYLRSHAWGNFRQMAKEITILPAMLKYLDGLWSEKGRLNENYARELMELFTMGTHDRYGNQNYTQEDVRMVAAAVTGWRFRFEEPAPNTIPPYFADYYFDFETKTTPFGAEAKVYGLSLANDKRITGDIIDVMFEKRAEAISWHIAKKVYQEFVYKGDIPEGAEPIIKEMADIFWESGFELKPMLVKLFKSEHFFDKTFRGAAIKSPYEYIVGTLRKLDFNLTIDETGSLQWYAHDNGQFLGNPTNVKGWEGYRVWLNSGTLPKRITMISRDITIGAGINPRGLNPHDGLIYDGIPWKNENIFSWASQFSSFGSGTFEEFVRDLGKFLCALPLSDEHVTSIIEQSGLIHTYEWHTISKESRIGIVRKVTYDIMRSAEFQLA